MHSNRRIFLGSLAGASALSLATRQGSYPYPISCNSYNWHTFYGRENKNWGENLAQDINTFAQTGIPAYEPSFNTPAEVLALAPHLQKHEIQMPSIYVNSVMHEAAEVQKSIESILAIATEAKKVGTRIIVTNPTPLQWGGGPLKNDTQLQTQAQGMEVLGKALRQAGLRLAYHTHDTELRAGAREFHHVMLNTTPENVGFCFDVHWVYRGSENSEVAVFDTLKLYGKRIVELHIRQSVGGVWSETFGKGDIDYQRLAAALKKMNIKPHLVIEQCIEEKSPNTLRAVEAHQQNLAAIKATFGVLLGN